MSRTSPSTWTLTASASKGTESPAMNPSVPVRFPVMPSIVGPWNSESSMNAMPSANPSLI